MTDNEWKLGQNIPMLNGDFDFKVQLNDDSVRTVCRRPTVDFSSLWFTDCTHPAQNAYCATSQIKAWKIVPRVLP